MPEAKTVPHPVPRLPVRSLRVTVTAGPDAGKSVQALENVLAVGTAKGSDLVLTDETVSGYHVEFSRETDRVHVRDLGSTNGTSIQGAWMKEGWVTPGTTLRVGKTDLLVEDAEVVGVELHATGSMGRLKGRAPAMRKLMVQIEKVARSNAEVLLLGDTGTGKELIAEALHHASHRAGGPFEVVDCAALHPTLVASELFGHERGAFTGAERQHIGAFERADGGTLFLDEIGEVPSRLQASLLGALERRRFRRVGGSRDIEVDVRVVSATHRDLRAAVNSGTFRQDLYYRLAVVRLLIPALRDRMSDLPVLLEHFLADAGYAGPMTDLFSPEDLAALEAHDWPGNVRELRNLVSATLALGERPDLDEERASPLSFPTDVLQRPYKEAKELVISRFERDYVGELLGRNGDNAAKSAREANMDRSYLFQLIRKHNLR